jgi:hypothetical protein
MLNLYQKFNHRRTSACRVQDPVNGHEYNSEVNKIRWMIEQVISHFKNWTIMHTDYRRPLKTFETTISAVVGLHFYRTV